MHASSFDKMADFRHRFLESRKNEPLKIVDLGSLDVNGSYRPLFAQRPWQYVGVDLAPGANVDVVLRDPYVWREFSSHSVDVVVCGQTFEHTEFFWETMLEIARILKPAGLVCVIAPASGPEHRFPLDCWRFFADGLHAAARYAELEILEVHTQWEDLVQYDNESNKWHESILIARKPAESFWKNLRRALRPWWNRWQRLSHQRTAALIQVFHSADGIHREKDSVYSYVPNGEWNNISIALPPGSSAKALRIDFIAGPITIEIAELRVLSGTQILFTAATVTDFDRIVLAGDVERLPSSAALCLKITGLDPQLHLPPLSSVPNSDRLILKINLRGAPETSFVIK
jgi:SAM-dependent methyltransferase